MNFYYTNVNALFLAYFTQFWEIVAYFTHLQNCIISKYTPSVFSIHGMVLKTPELIGKM